MCASDADVGVVVGCKWRRWWEGAVMNGVGWPPFGPPSDIAVGLCQLSRGNAGGDNVGLATLAKLAILGT